MSRTPRRPQSEQTSAAPHSPRRRNWEPFVERHSHHQSETFDFKHIRRQVELSRKTQVFATGARETDQLVNHLYHIKRILLDGPSHVPHLSKH